MSIPLSSGRLSIPDRVPVTGVGVSHVVSNRRAERALALLAAQVLIRFSSWSSETAKRTLRSATYSGSANDLRSP